MPAIIYNSINYPDSKEGKIKKNTKKIKQGLGISSVETKKIPV